jgi:YD repeat-containing protein
VRSYDVATGRLLGIQTGPNATPKSVQDLEYAWRSNSTLHTRRDAMGTSSTGDDRSDLYNYDALERMTAQTTSGAVSRTLDFGYSGIGNLTGKTSNVSGDLNVTGFSYAVSGKPQRLGGVTIGGIATTLVYDANGNIARYDAASGDDTFLVYDARNNVTAITVGASADTTTPTVREQFWYDPDGQRYLGKEAWNASGTQQHAITVYLGDYEEARLSTGTVRTVKRVQATGTARWVRRIDESGGIIGTSWLYLHRDHLGSVDAVTSASGVLLNEKTGFDPFGARRQHSWASDITTASLNTTAGQRATAFPARLHRSRAVEPHRFRAHERASRVRHADRALCVAGSDRGGSGIQSDSSITATASVDELVRMRDAGDGEKDWGSC